MSYLTDNLFSKKCSKAFEKLIPDASGKYEIRFFSSTDSPLTFALIRFQNDIYKITNGHFLEQYCKMCIQDEELAMEIPATIWSEVTSGIKIDKPFLDLLQKACSDNADQLQGITDVIDEMIDAKASPANTEKFWNILEDADPELYAKAIIVMASMMDKDEVIADLLNQYVTFGDFYLKELTTGIFKDINISNNDEIMANSEDLFYIYTVGDGWWS